MYAICGSWLRLRAFRNNLRNDYNNITYGWCVVNVARFMPNEMRPDNRKQSNELCCRFFCLNWNPNAIEIATEDKLIIPHAKATNATTNQD